MTKRSPTTPAWTWLSLLLLAACGGPPPVIASFTASPDHIAYGDKATLSWNITNATSISISGGVGDEPTTQHTVDVTPTQTTTYVLTARDGGGAPVTASVTVTLVPKLAMTGGTYSGDQLGLTLAAVLRDAAGVPPPSDTVVNLTSPGGSPFTVTCPGGKPLCVVELPGAAPVNGGYSATASVGGATLSTTFFVDTSSRLPPVAPIWIQQVDAQTLDSSWAPMDGAMSYRVYPVDLSAPTQAIGPVQIVSTPSARLTTSQPMSTTSQYGIRVEASEVDLSMATAPATLPVPNSSTTLGKRLGGVPNSWQYLDPSQYVGNDLSVSFNDLGPTEQLAVLVINAGGQDNAPATIGVTGTLPAPPPPQALMATAPDAVAGSLALHTPPAAHEREREEEAAVIKQLLRTRGATALSQPMIAPAPPAPAPTNTSFCVRQGTGTTFVRKAATLQWQSAHGLFYVDNDDTSQYTAQAPAIWNSLESSWETRAYPGDTSTFGAESDVDHNGKLIIFFTHELGPAVNGGILLGYYTPLDVAYALDTTPTCTGTKSNQADMFYMNSLGNIVTAFNSTNPTPAVTASDVYTQTYPNTLAHEFQHLINFNQHCLVRNCSNVEDVWINEGLSMVAQDIGGFGWNQSNGRSEGTAYMDRRTGNILSYNGRGLTKWESDPIGNYEGAHSFIRYWADRMGTPVLSALVQTSETGLPNLANALGGYTFARSFAEWGTAEMFSNETFTPAPTQFDFQGTNWTPLHTQLRHLNYVPLGPGSAQALTLRQDGWNAFLTGTPAGTAATITVTSTQTVKPTVVVVRFSGSLPQQ